MLLHRDQLLFKVACLFPRFIAVEQARVGTNTVDYFHAWFERT